MVYGVTILLLFMILAVFSVLYQQWNVQTIANESAMRVAQTYKYTEADPMTGFVSSDQVSEVRPYRYLWSADEAETEAREKIVDYASERLRKTTFAKSASDPVISVSEEHDALSRRHLKVSITGTYQVPFGEALSFFGLGGMTTYSVTSYAECLDLSDYLTTTSFVGEKANLSDFDSSILEAANSVLGLIENVLE